MKRDGKKQKVDAKAAVEIEKGLAKKGAKKLTGDDGKKAMERSKECRVRLSLSLSCMSMKATFGPRCTEGKKKKKLLLYRFLLTNIGFLRISVPLFFNTNLPKKKKRENNSLYFNLPPKK